MKKTKLEGVKKALVSGKGLTAKQATTRFKLKSSKTFYAYVNTLKNHGIDVRSVVNRQGNNSYYVPAAA